MAFTIMAPAKLNLTLEVLSKRADGYHELRSIIQTINLCDRLVFEDSRETVFRSESAGWQAEKSLLPKAVGLFRETTGVTKGVSITVEKHIPMMAGLGGDSSDAAAVLKGLNQLWNAGLSREELLFMAKELGSDVSFFLYGNTALMEGRGERITPLKSVGRQHLVLVIPSVEVPAGKTGRLYSALNVQDYTDGKITRKYAEALENGAPLPEPYNVFEKVAYRVFPGLSEVREEVRKLSGQEVRLAGSGPVLFTLVKNQAEAEELAGKLRNNGHKALITETLSDTSYGKCD